MSFHCYYRCWGPACGKEVHPGCNQPKVPDGWIEVRERDQPAHLAIHYCSRECLLKRELQPVVA